MKALTLTEPYASLVMIGAKKIETRSWYTNYRGPIAIHAAKGMTGDDLRFALTNPAVSVPLGWGPYRWQADRVKEAFPVTRGKVIATATLVHCGEIGCNRAGWCGYYDRYGNSHENDWTGVRESERALGLYVDGRYAWILADVVRLPEPIPATGALGLWEWEPPAGLEGAA